MSDNIMKPEPKVGDLRVWWIPQIPGKPFHVHVESVEEAVLILNTLAAYDAFQLENNIKPDYCNVGGLEVYDSCGGNDGNSPGWCEWYNDEGDDIDQVIKDMNP